jgi:hypothetical protein
MAGVAVATTATMAVMTAPAAHATSAVLIRVNISIPLLFGRSDPGLLIRSAVMSSRQES